MDNWQVVLRLGPLVTIVLLGVAAGGGNAPAKHAATRGAARIAFLRDFGSADDDTRRKLVIVDGRGGNARTVKLPRGSDVEEFSWAPDGRRLVLSAWDPDRYRGVLYVVRADGTRLHKVKRLFEAVSYARWSPRGNLIAFDMQDDGAHAVWVIRPDGTHAKKLTPGQRFGYPTWSPNGRKIAYSSFNGEHAWVHLMNPDGSHKRKFTRLDTGEWTMRGLSYWGRGGLGFVKSNGKPGGLVFHVPYVWEGANISRDGRAIALSGPILPHGDWEIGIATAAGVRRLTDNDRQDVDPDLASDRRALVFAGARTPAKGEAPPPADIYVINADGSGERKLTESPQSESSPSWAPSP